MIVQTWRSCTSTTPGCAVRASPERVRRRALAAPPRAGSTSSRGGSTTSSRARARRSGCSRAGRPGASPVRTITSAATATPTEPSEVGENVPERRLDVEVCAARAERTTPAATFTAMPSERDREHPAAEHVAAGRESRMDRLEEDPDRERDEQHAVRERREHLCALVAVRALRRRRLRRRARRRRARERARRCRRACAPRPRAARGCRLRMPPTTSTTVYAGRQGERDGERAAARRPVSWSWSCPTRTFYRSSGRSPWSSGGRVDRRRRDVRQHRRGEEHDEARRTPRREGSAARAAARPPRAVAARTKWWTPPHASARARSRPS